MSSSKSALCQLLWVVGLFSAFAIGLLVRGCVLGMESADYLLYLKPWYEHLMEAGRWKGLNMENANYPPLYLYFLSLSTFLPVASIYAVKFITLIWEPVAAWYLWRIVQRVAGEKRAWGAVGVFFLLPTVILNGALWGQCDVMYTACLLGCLFYTLEKRQVAALVAYGLAFALKPQAMFLAPFVLWLFVHKRFEWKWCWVPFVVYCVCGIPQMLAGRDFLHVIGHWLMVYKPHDLQYGTVPNWYMFVPMNRSEFFYNTGIALTVLATVSYLFLRSPKSDPKIKSDKKETQDEFLILMAFLSVLLVPFFMPGMHERYFFPADILALLYAFCRPRGWVVAFLVQLASFFSYFNFLWNVDPLDASVLLGSIVISILLTLVWLYKKGKPAAPMVKRPA